MKQKNKPFVSVIMPVHNAGGFLGQAIESILKQTYKNLEFIIVDDASTDNSWNIIQNYFKRHKKTIKIHQISKQTNSAGNGAMNYGLQFAKGDFIARMDADDIARPLRIEKQVAYFLSHTDTILVGTQAYIIDKDGKRIGKKSLPTTHERIYSQYGVIHPIIHPTVMIRRTMLPNPNRIYEMKWDINDDYYTFFKLMNYGKFANLPEYLFNYRVHGKNLSLAKPKSKFVNSVKIRLEAIQQFNYQMTVKNWILMVSQVLVISLIPERSIVPLYMFLRGMSGRLERTIL